MPGCGALNCKNRSEKGFKLYALPSGDRNKERRQLWAKYIGRDPLPEKIHICEAHFTSDQFELNRADGKKKLKWNAVPRIFTEENEPTEENAVQSLRAENDKNPLPDTCLFSDITKKSSLSLQGDKCNTSKQTDIAFETHSKFKEEIFLTSDEELEDTINISEFTVVPENYMRYQNGPHETSSEEQQARPFDLTKVCRICFGKTQLESIFVATYENYTLHSLLELCSSVKINKNTQFKQICVRCKSQLIENYIFIRKVITSNDTLQLAECSKKRNPHWKCEDEVEEIFIFVDKYNKSSEICNEVSGKNISNSLIKSEENIMNKSNTVEVCIKSTPDNCMIENMNKDEIRNEKTEEKIIVSKLLPIQSEHMSKINMFSEENENDIFQYYLIKANENTIGNFVHKGSIFKISEKEITKILPNLIDMNEIRKHAITTTNSDSERSKLEKLTPLESTLHLQDHTYVEKYEEVLDLCKKNFLCDKCGMSLSSISNLKIHIKRIHEGIKSTYSKCHKCNILFRSQAAYETHRSQHIGKHHCCETCGKLFAGMAHLRQHLRRHTTIRPFACSICNKSFRAKYLLNYHMVRHLKEKKHTCIICNRSFMKINDLRSHISKMHPEKIRSKLFTCEKCDYKSFKKRALQIHLKKLHILAAKGTSKIIEVA